jgi:hypothetical protein
MAMVEAASGTLAAERGALDRTMSALVPWLGVPPLAAATGPAPAAAPAGP